MTKNEKEELLLSPKPGTAASRARDLGVDLSVTVSNLRLTPEERLLRLERARKLMKEIRAARQRGPVNGRD